MSTLSIDPGSADPGPACVWFDDAERLCAASCTFFPTPPAHFARLRTVVVERMQADARTRNIDVRYLLACQFAGALAAGFAAGPTRADVVDLTPTEWKGNEPKPAQHARLWRVLDAAERAVLGGAETERRIAAAVEKGALCRWSKPGDALYGTWKGHNLLDAAALGCVYLGRMARHTR